MAEEKFHHEGAAQSSGEPHDEQFPDDQISSDAAYGDEDDLEVDPGVSAEEIHTDESEDTNIDVDDGVHGTAHEVEEEHAVEAEAPAAPPDEPAGPAKHWYIIHAYSGFEQKVAESLKSRSQAFGFAERLGQILIPTEEVVELRNGKKVTSKRLLYPGYVLVEMEMDDELWHAVKSTPRVTGFVGGGTKPVPLTADEVNAVLYRQASSAERPRPKMTFEKNENVKIVDGPFTNFSGKVDEINSERNTLRVMVTIFGRSTPVELDFLQVEKI
ncbi:MAG: transcription termination/antitermination protein NusG [Acidobacteriota bacterium]|nr:transcription termination/antitermination protein NusG [Acidobacteriota bacterium]